MKKGKMPNPNEIHPITGYDKEIYVKPTISNPNIVVGDFDSLGFIPKGDNVVTLPVKKDVTDMQYAVELGIEKGRVQHDWISASEGEKFASTIRRVTAEIQELGPSPLKAQLAEGE